MSIQKFPTAEAVGAKTVTTRREHPTPGQKPRMSIEAHASMGSARQKNMQAFLPTHPSMTGGNRGHAVSKGVPPAAPIVAHSNVGRPTPELAIHSGATGRRSTGADTPGESHAQTVHHASMADRVLDEPMDRGLVNNKIHDAERHHSTVGAKGSSASFASDRLPPKPVDSQTTPQSLIAQFKRFAAGE